MSETTKSTGVELSQMARALFNEAADDWYLSFLLQIAVGVFGVVIAFVSLSDDARLVTAIIAFFGLGASYFLRIKSDEKYDRAETMRRQAALSEGLGLSVSATQISDWRLRAGTKILQKINKNQRPVDYYASTDYPGGKKLLNMTIESAFYTRHLYIKIKHLVGMILAVVLVIVFLFLSILPISSFSTGFITKAAYVLYLLLPILLSIDLLFWFIRLTRSSEAILEVEKDMERLSRDAEIDDADVIRLVSEYNCVVSGGIPIHNYFFNRWHDEIKSLWLKRSE